MITPETPATQVAHPWRATARTVLAALLAAAVLLPAVMPAITAWAEEHAGILPEWATAGIAAASVAVAATAGLITRILAVPGVNAWLEEYLPFLSAAPRQ